MKLTPTCAYPYLIYPCATKTDEPLNLEMAIANCVGQIAHVMKYAPLNGLALWLAVLWLFFCPLHLHDLLLSCLLLHRPLTLVCARAVQVHQRENLRLQRSQTRKHSGVSYSW